MKVASTVLLAGALLIVAGCNTFYTDDRYGASESQAAAARVEMARQQQAHEFEIIKARGESTAYQLEQLERRIDQLDRTAQITSQTQTEIAGLRQEISQIRADRDNLKREIIGEISREITTLLERQESQRAAQTAATRRSASQSGYEHKVERGQTLSEISVAYGVTVDKIKRANNLKSDVIQVGQLLFIPD